MKNDFVTKKLTLTEEQWDWLRATSRRRAWSDFQAPLDEAEILAVTSSTAYLNKVNTPDPNVCSSCGGYAMADSCCFRCYDSADFSWLKGE